MGSVALLCSLITFAMATASPASASSQTGVTPAVAKLQALVAKAKAGERSLLAQVQTARETIARDRVQISKSTSDLSQLISAEYTGDPGGFLAVVASSSLNSALDTQITLQQLSDSQRQQLEILESRYQQEQQTESTLRSDQRQAAVTEARLQAEEIAAQYQAELAAAAPAPPSAVGAEGTQVAQPGSAASPSPSSPAAPAPAQTPTPTPVPTPVPTPLATPAVPQPPSSGTGGAFTTNTNLTLASGISLGQIQNFLQGTPLAADAPYFLQAEQTSHVSAIYLVADAVLETGFGSSSLYTNKHNLFGFQAYDANPYVDGATFSSDQECISYVSWFVSIYYLTPPGSQVANYGTLAGTVASGAFYNGPTPTGMNVDYASDPLWASKIASIGAALQSIPG